MHSDDSTQTKNKFSVYDKALCDFERTLEGVSFFPCTNTQQQGQHYGTVDNSATEFQPIGPYHTHYLYTDQ